MEAQLIYMIIIMGCIWLVIDAHTSKVKGERGLVERLIRGLFGNE